MDEDAADAGHVRRARELFLRGYLYVAGGLSGGTKLIEEKRTLAETAGALKFAGVVGRTVGVTRWSRHFCKPEFRMSTYVPSSSMAMVPNERDRLAAVLAHGGTLFAWFVAPLAIYLLKRGDSRWVEHQAMQSLLWSLMGSLLTLVTCGLALPVFLVWHVVATVKILRGQDYDYPIVGDFSRGLVGLPSSVTREEELAL